MYRPKHLSNQPKTLSSLKSFFKYKIYNILSLFMLFSLKSNSNSMAQPTVKDIRFEFIFIRESKYIEYKPTLSYSYSSSYSQCIVLSISLVLPC